MEGKETSTANHMETAEGFQNYLIDLILEKKYTEVVQLFTSVECKKYFAFIKEIGSDLYRDVCLPQLNKSCYDLSFPLYCCVEELLKIIAQHGAREEILMELLELVEECDSEQVFTSALHALQIVLLRLADSKPMALQWALNSVQTRLSKLELPAELTAAAYDAQKMALLEQEATIQTLLTHYVTVGLFYTPLLQQCLNSAACTTKFRDNSLTRRNILCCFFIQLLDKPIALLELSSRADKPGSNAYTRQLTRQLVLSIVQCLKADPLYLLQFVEERMRFKRRLDSSKGVYEMSSLNIFTVEEHAPMLGLAVFYYLLFIEFKDSEQIQLPSIYAPLFFYESLLYLVIVFIKCDETQLHMRGLLLAQHFLKMLKDWKVHVPVKHLELPLHREFCQYLTTIIGYTEPVEVRRLGVLVLDTYVKSFDIEGRYLVVKALMNTVKHNSLLGHLATLYKNMVAENLRNLTLPGSFHKEDFRQVMLKNICNLPRGVETDLADHSGQIMAALNTLIYFGLSDKNNLTGFWSFSQAIETHYLDPLRTALNFSICHYKEQIKQMKQGGMRKIQEPEQRILNMIEISNMPNSDALELDSERKIIILEQHLTTFDLMAHLLGYVTSLIATNQPKTQKFVVYRKQRRNKLFIKQTSDEVQ